MQVKSKTCPMEPACDPSHIYIYIFKVDMSTGFKIIKKGKYYSIWFKFQGNKCPGFRDIFENNCIFRHIF